MTADVAQLGIRVDSATTKTAATDLDKMTAAAGRADVAVDRVGAAHGKMAVGASKASFQSRMVAQQLSQVAQQSMATGNFVQALAIQLPDMALGFGAVGIAAGVVAGVALPLLVSAFGGTSSKATEAATSIEGLDGTTKAYLVAAQAAAVPTSELALQYGNLAVQARAALQAMSDVALVEAITQTNAAVQGLADSLLAVYAAQGGGRASGSRVGLADDFGLAADQAQRLTDAIVALKNSQGLESQARAAAEVQRQLLAAYGSVAKMPAPLQAAYAQMAQITLKAGEVAGQVDKGRMSVQQMLAAAGGLSGVFSAAAGAAQGLAGTLANAATNAWNLAGAMGAANKTRAAAVGGGRGLGPQGPALDPNGFRAQLAGQNRPAIGGASGGGGGGGGATDDFATRLAALQTEHESETAQANKWYADAQAVLADRRSIEILGVQGHKDKLLEIEKIHQQQMAAIAANAQAARLSQTAGLFGALASIAEAGGKKSAKAVATFQAIEGTINAYGAAIKALNTPGITLAGRFAAYASVLGAGLKGVAAIRSAGGVGGGGGAGAPAAQAISSVAASRSSELVVHVPGNALMTADMWSMIFDGVIGEGKARGMDSFSGIRFAT